MKKYLFSVLLFVSMSASAEHMDVIEFKLVDGCSFDKYMAIVADFNKDFGKANGYSARVAMPLQGENLVSLYWLGTSANATAFGKAWDAWRDGLGDANSVPTKLWARFQECSLNITRHSYDIY